MRKAFTLIELLVVISIIALLIAILLPALGSARQSARQLQSSTQVRGIHQGFVIFGESNDGYYPGMAGLFANASLSFTDQNNIATINDGGTTAGSSTTARFAIALEDGLFTAEYAISPAETNPDVQTWQANQTYSATNDHITSYAISMISSATSPVPGVAVGRAREWRTTSNSAAIVMGDRATAMGFYADTSSYQSLWSNGEPNYRGSVLMNDNSVQFLYDREIEGTKYASHRNALPDNLFIGLNDQNVGINGGDRDNNCDLVPGNGAQNTLPAS